MINIKNWEIEGYKSVSAPLKIESEIQLTLLSGTNGAGKSTLIEALRWGLFGSESSNVNKADLVTRQPNRHVGFLGTRVSVYIETPTCEFSVHRCIDYKGKIQGYSAGDGVLLFVDGQLSKERIIKDVQIRIGELLGITEQMFQLLCVVPQYGNNFLSLSSSEKTSLLSYFFDFNWVDVAQQKAAKGATLLQEKKTKLSLTLVGVEHKLEVLSQKIENQVQQKAMFAENKQKRIAMLWDSMTTYTNKIKEYTEYKLALEQQLSEIPEQDLTDLKKLEKEGNAELTTLINQINKLKQQKAVLSERLRNLKHPEKPTTDCLVCKRPLDSSTTEKVLADYVKKVEEVDAQIVLLSQEKSGLQKQKTDLESAYTDIDEGLANLRVSIIEAEKINQQRIKVIQDIRKIDLSWWDEQVKITTKSIEDIEKEEFVETDYTQEFDDLQEQQKALKDEIDAINEKPLNFWANIGFTQKGIKAFITTQILNSINSVLKRYEYIWRVELIVSDKVSRAIDVRILSKEGDLIPYKSLSGGERRRVELIITFALREVMEALYSPINLLIFDEPFDGLDQEGREQIMELIRLRAKDCAVFMTSHVPLDLSGVSILEVKKEKYTFLE